MWIGAGGSFYLNRTERGTAMFLYGWDDTQSAWGPDRAKAHRFASTPAAIDVAVFCGGPNEKLRVTPFVLMLSASEC